MKNIGRTKDVRDWEVDDLRESPSSNVFSASFSIATTGTPVNEDGGIICAVTARGCLRAT